MPEFRFKDLVRHALLSKDLRMVVVMPEPDSDGWINVVSVELSKLFDKPPTEADFVKWCKEPVRDSRDWDGYKSRQMVLIAHENNWWIDNHGELGYNAQDQEVSVACGGDLPTVVRNP